MSFFRFALAALLAAAILAPTGAFAAPAAKAPRAPAPKQERSACKTAEFRAIVDVGHSAEVPGAFSARGVPEYEFNLRLAQRIEKALLQAGFKQALLLITPGPAQAGLYKRVARANAWPADLFLSIHHDSVPEWFLQTWQHAGKQARFSDRFAGHSLFVSYENGQSEQSLLFARLLGRELKAQGLTYTPHYTLAAMNWRRRDLLDADYGVYRYDQLIVLRATKVPAVLLEAGSIINRDEELVMGSADRQTRIAAAVTQAVRLFCAERAK
jgi:N-acetylmuramoyl-L-alanine amidase